jgi:hypothetical protein
MYCWVKETLDEYKECCNTTKLVGSFWKTYLQYRVERHALHLYDGKLWN